MIKFYLPVSNYFEYQRNHCNYKIIKNVSFKIIIFFLDLSRSVGILLYGPNGVGKTFVSQSIANDMNVPVIKINASIVSWFNLITNGYIKHLYIWYSFHIFENISIEYLAFVDG